MTTEAPSTFPVPTRTRIKADNGNLSRHDVYAIKDSAECSPGMSVVGQNISVNVPRKLTIKQGLRLINQAAADGRVMVLGGDNDGVRAFDSILLMRDLLDAYIQGRIPLPINTEAPATTEG